MNRKQSATYISRKTALAVAVSGALSLGAGVPTLAEDAMEEVVVQGIRGSLKRALDIKRDATGVVDSIAQEDIGKFPDLNVAESLQRVTGVSIDRDGGEGQAVSVRGFGPQFNTVLVNGRQIATDSGGREFNFDVLTAEYISGADVYKSGNARLQEGGIGATVNISTARPLDNPGLQLIGSVKGVYETLSEDIAPGFALLASNTFGDDRFGVLFSYSHEQRDVQINRILTAGWQSGQTISNKQDGVLFTDAYIPRNWDQTVDIQERTRTNANLVFQFAPTDDLVITLDGYVSEFEVDSEVTDLASWFEPDRVGAATIDPATGTLLTFNQEVGSFRSSGDPASDFVSHTRNSRDVSNSGFGLNVEWDINDALSAEFDFSTTSAKNDRAGRDRFSVVGIINSYSFDGRGSTPTVRHDGFDGTTLPDANLSRIHYNERGNMPTDEDDISEFRADFEYLLDSGPWQTLNFGAYHQTREKSQFQIFGSACPPCGYSRPAPNDVIGFRPFTAENFFSGLISTFYTFDGEAYLTYIADEDIFNKYLAELRAMGTAEADLPAFEPLEPTLQNNRYTVNEDITSLYVDVTLEFDIGRMPTTVNFGARYAETDIEVEAVQSFISDVVATSDQTLFANRFGPATNIAEGGSYSNLLPNFAAKLEVQEDLQVRLAYYESLTRATMSELSPATTFGEPRRQNLTASGGNPNLKPFRAENWDLAVEWYYSDESAITFTHFWKKVEDFITIRTGPERYELTDRKAADGYRCAGSPECSATNAFNIPIDIVGTTEELNGQFEVYTVSRPRNGETADVDGYELAITHVFDFGLGILANATVVDSNVSIGADTSKTFALEGLGDSQNLVVFYETDLWQVRLAYNNRDAFLRLTDNGFNGEPVNTDTFGQWDISASFEVNENFTLFFEGINILEEELVQTGRFKNQIYSIEDNGARYTFGVRGRF